MYITTGDLSDSPNLEKNLGIISANVIAGTGIFSDIAASFSDFFGGSSESYKKQFEWITKTALTDLKSKSRELGGNAIMGLRIDTNELSGKNKQMLMITVYGSAIKLNNILIQPESKEIVTKKSEISVDEYVNFRAEKEKCINLQNQGVIGVFSRTDLAECTSSECIHIILEKLFSFDPYSEGYAVYELSNETMNNVNMWLRIIDPKAILQFLNILITSEKIISNILLDNYNKIFNGVRIFDINLIETLLKKQDRQSRRLGLLLSWSTKMFYSRSDIDEFKKIIELIHGMTPAEEFEKKSFTSTKMLWNCANNHEVDATNDTCNQCGLGKYGLKPQAINDHIKELNLRIEQLDELLE